MNDLSEEGKAVNFNDARCGVDFSETPRWEDSDGSRFW